MNLRSLVCLALSAGSISAYAQSFEPGDNVAGLMLGLGGHYGHYNHYSSSSPGIGLFYEKATAVNVGPGVLGLGGFLGYKHLSYDDNWYYGVTRYHYDYSWTYTILGVRGAYHYNEWHGVPKLDTYGGLMLGFNVVSFKDDSDYPSGYHYTGDSDSYMSLTLFLGARYYFSENFGALAELGYGVSYFSLGVAYKF